MPPDCDLCARIERAERGDNPFAVVRTATGYVNLADVQYHEGYTIFVAKRCVNELHELPEAERDLYLHEMALVAEAVFHAFRPRKLNYELLGNGAPHLHWHLFPRHADDPHPRGPVWEDPGFLRALAEDALAEPGRIDELRGRLRSALEATDLTIERRFA
ncbi:MAG TPA: HIT family protein [Acidimicrobiia bacterium]|nr:HIT family protein [Acidimicrobiia bacterium]